MEELFKVKDEEIAKLLLENKSLLDELRQCQADKEFVWSLWKRLQVSSPDLTQAISLVLQREKEKSETKDQKVLEILQTKDQQIVDLQQTVTSLKRENDKLCEIKVSVEGDRNKQIDETQQLKSHVLKMKLDHEMLQNNLEENKKDYKSSLDVAESERVHLNEQITNLITDLQEMRTNCQIKSDELDSVKQVQTQIDNEKKDLQAVIKRLMAEKQILESDLDSVKFEFEQLRNGIDFTKHNLKTRDEDYQDLKESYDQLKLHNQHQKQVIAQLQELNNNNQIIVKEQTSQHKNETDSLQSMYNEILRKYEDLIEKHKQLKLKSEERLTRIQAQDKALETTKKELKKSIGMASGRGRGNNYDYNYDEMDNLEEQVHKQRREIEHLREKLKENMQNKRSRRGESPPERDYDQTFSPIVERGTTRNGQRCRSMSPGGQNKRVNVMQKKLKATETKLDDTKHLLELKRSEIKELQRAHNKRLERLKVLQADYRSLKSNLMENDERNSPRKHRCKSRMSKPQNLRQENSDSVWNDLAIYRQENKALAQDKMMLEEEVDHLRVQTAMDRATIQDLNLCLKSEKEELMARMRPIRDEDRLSSTPKKLKRNISPTREPKPTRRQTKNLERRLENASEDNRILKKDRDRMLDDNKVFKNEIKSLKREITETRQTGTKIRQENSELRRKVESLKGGKEQFERETAILRQENQGLRTENSGVRSENSTLRTENSDLRQDVNDLKQELTDLKCELREIDHGLGVADKDKHSNTKKTANVHRKRGGKTAAVRKHQKFLNRSINEMKEAFGGDFDAEGLASTGAEDTTATTGIVDEDRYGRSDVSSLGQSIVRASRQPLDGGYDIDKDEDDTLVDDEPQPVSVRRGNRPHSAQRPSSLPRSGVGVVTALKQRLASLQTQCNTLRNAKSNATKKAIDEKERSDLIQSELSSCQNRLKTAKQSIQRLNREAEVLLREKEDLQRALNESQSQQPLPQQYSDADYKYMENKFKSSSTDVNRMSEQIKDLKKEVEGKKDQCGNEKERVSRLERDVAMKRQLIDELRVKVKDFESKTHTEHQNSVELEERMKQIEDDLTHKKNHVESLRRQLQVATKEKARYETMYNKSRDELEKRSGQVSSLQASKLEAETVSSRLEEAAEKQLNSLASRSEQALEKLKSKLEKSEERSNEFATFVHNFSSHIVDLLLRLRDSYYREKIQLSEEEEGKLQTVPPSSSMSHAQNLACNILNMSQSDFQDLMAPVDVGRKRQTERDMWDGERSTSSKADQQWKKKVEKIANENPPFAKSLCRLLWDKVQDAVKLGEDRLRLHADHLEQQLLEKKKS